MYMDKIAVGPRAKGCIDINAPENLARVAKLWIKSADERSEPDRERHADI